MGARLEPEPPTSHVSPQEECGIALRAFGRNGSAWFRSTLQIGTFLLPGTAPGTAPSVHRSESQQSRVIDLGIVHQDVRIRVRRE